MEQKTKFEKLESELNTLPFGKVLEINNLTRQEANNLFDLYKRNYIVRGPCSDNSDKYILSFQLNPYKIGAR